MNGIENIIAHIKSDSNSEVERIGKQAEEKCLAIREEYQKQANDTYGKLVMDGAREATLTVERLNSAANLEAKKQVLACKQELISRTFSEAVSRLGNLPDETYVPLLAKLAAQSSQSGSEQIIFSDKDRDRVGQAVCDQANALLSAMGKKAALTLSETTRATGGGIIVSNGDIEVNCTTAALVAQLKEALSASVAEILFD